MIERWVLLSSCLCACVPVDTHAESREGWRMLTIFLYHLGLFPLRQCLSLNLRLTTQCCLVWQASQLVSFLSNAEATGLHSHAWFVCGCRRFELRSSGLHKCSYTLSHLPITDEQLFMLPAWHLIVIITNLNFFEIMPLLTDFEVVRSYLFSFPTARFIGMWCHAQLFHKMYPISWVNLWFGSRDHADFSFYSSCAMSKSEKKKWENIGDLMWRRILFFGITLKCVRHL